MAELTITASTPVLKAAASPPWQRLPPELLLRIVSGLPPNDAACNVRLSSKAAAAALSSSQHRTVRLSQPSTHTEFVRRWGRPGAMRPLTLAKRRLLLSLTAASGCLDNLQWLAERAGSSLTAGVLEAAAVAGRLGVCRWLQQQGCAGQRDALGAAAGAGHEAVVQWIVESMLGREAGGSDRDTAGDRGEHAAGEQGLDGSDEEEGVDDGAERAASNPAPRWARVALRAAARAGRLTLLRWLVRRGRYRIDRSVLLSAAKGGNAAVLDWLLLRLGRPGPGGAGALFAGPLRELPGGRLSLLEAAACGCELAALQQLFSSPMLLEWEEDSLAAPELQRSSILAAAAASATPDWRAKVEWLEAQEGYVLGHGACTAAAACADAVDRLTWLRARGCALAPRAAQTAVRAGNTAALQLLLTAEGAGAPADPVALAASLDPRTVSLELLQLLAVRGGCSFGADTLAAVVQTGSLPMVAWLAETPGVQSLFGPPQQLERQQQQREQQEQPQQEPQQEQEEQQEQQQEQPQQQELARVWAAAAGLGCMEMLAWLRARGLRWGDGVWAAAAGAGCSEEALEWLAQEGCPMQSDGTPYLAAARHGDCSSVACMRRLGVPLGPHGHTFTAAVHAYCGLPMLRCLLEQGCPVDWPAAGAAADGKCADGEGSEWLLRAFEAQGASYD